MSVLNEVLKNLDEKASSHRSYSIPNTVYQSYSIPWFVWLIISALVLTTGYLAFQLSTSKQAEFNIPYDIYDFEKESSTSLAQAQVSTQIKVQTKEIQLSKPPKKSRTQSQKVGKDDLNSDRTKSVDHVRKKSEKIDISSNEEKKVDSKSHGNLEPVVASMALPSPAESPKKSIVRKTDATRAEEQAIDAYEEGNIKTVKKLIQHTQPSIQENFKLRIMLKEDPEKVLPYLKRNKPNFASNGELLALAAQAQQRSGDYRTSAIYYQRLIKNTPSEPRWHAGLAISLDGLGERKKAAAIYRSVLKSSALPVPLRRFVQQRLTELGPQNG